MTNEQIPAGTASDAALTTSPATWGAVDAYLDALFPEDEVLREVTRSAEDAGLPSIAVSAQQGRFLQLLAQLHGARRALELGTLAGYSAICLARGLAGPDRHLTTLELDPRHAAVARANLDRAGLADVVDVRVGPAAESARTLLEEGAEPFDLVFIDADKPSGPTYLDLAMQLVRPGGLVVVDNVVRRGRVVDEASEDPAVRGSRAVLEQAARDPRVTATTLQTVGAKGYDGFLLLRVADLA